MSNYSKYNIIYRLQKWMDSVPGQTFLNYGYSWGASVVIAGALFKLTHLAGANIMLFLGMGTEVIVFFLSAFDRPFDKTDDGKELPTHVYDDEEEELQDAESASSADSTSSAQGAQIAFTPIVTGPVASQPTSNDASYQPQSSAASTDSAASTAPSATPYTGNVATPNAGNVAAPTAEQVAAAIINQQGSSLSQTQQQTPEMVEAQTSYVDALKNLTDMLTKVGEQSERLTRDSEEMENLNRTLTGISKVYEMQLKGASQQIGTIDQINEQSRKLAEQINQLNKIYARMIEAMTVNMRATAPGATTPNVD